MLDYTTLRSRRLQPIGTETFFLGSLMRRVTGEDGLRLNINPDYQRGRVWSDEQASRFIGYLAEGGDSETVAHLAASTAVRSDVTRRTWVVARDQPFWARRLRELGIASDPLDPRRPTPAAVREAAMQATAAPVRRRAEAVAAGVSAEPDGADRPVAALERVRSRWDGRRGA